eukprot:CFRG6822T1
MFCKRSLLVSLCLSALRFANSQATIMFKEELPLVVQQIIPSEVDPDAIYRLSKNQDLTVIFSRPVIALGSDFITSDNFESKTLFLPSNLVPFTITCGDNNNHKKDECEIVGTLRWVTTSIARFTPTGPWPTDLIFHINIPSDLTTFDGVTINSSNAKSLRRAYRTSALSWHVSEVVSAKALEYTGKQWTSRVPQGSRSHANMAYEMPPDAYMEITFMNGIVDVESIKNGLRLTCLSKGKCSDDDNGLEVTVTKCPLASPLPIITTPVTTGTCIRIRPKSRLKDDTDYQIVLPTGTIYNSQTKSTLRSDLVVYVVGLLPFKIDVQPQPAARNTRYRMFLNHGLRDADSRSNIADSVIMYKKDKSGSLGPAVDLSVTVPCPAVLQIEGNFKPEGKYELMIKRSENVRDGFGQPLIGVGPISINATNIDNSVVYADNWIGSARFPMKNMMKTWDVITVDKFGFKGLQCYRATTQPLPRAVVAYVVTESNLKNIFTNLYEANKKGYAVHWDEFGLTPDLIKLLPANELAYISTIEIELQTLLEVSGTVLLRYFTEVNTVYSIEPPICAYVPVSRFLSSSSTELSVVVENNNFLLWAIDGESGKPKTDARVELHHPAGLDGSRGKRIVDDAADSTLGIGMTNNDGVAVMSRPSEHEFQAFVIDNEGKIAFTESIRYRTGKAQSLSAVVVLDRGMYRGGEEVHVKGYVRMHDSHTGTSSVPTKTAMNKLVASDENKTARRAQKIIHGRTRSDMGIPSSHLPQSTADEMTISLPPMMNEHKLEVGVDSESGGSEAETGNQRLPSANGSFQLLISGPGNFKLTLPITVDEDYGTFDTSFETESDAKHGVYHVSLVNMCAVNNCPLQNQQAGSATYTIADPRIPTALLTLESAKRSVKPRENVEVTISTSMYTGGTIEGATVIVKWNEVKPYLGYPMDKEPVQPLFGSATVVTDSTGVATVQLDTGDVLAGSNIDVIATWMGPTGELLTQAVAVSVAYTDYSMTLKPTTNDVLPGEIVGFYVQVIDDSSKPLVEFGISLSIYELNRSIPLTPAEPSGCLSGMGLQVGDTVQCIAKGLAIPACNIVLPNSVGTYVAVATGNDANGNCVNDVFYFGKTANEWKEHPLTSYSSPSIVLDKTEYKVGDTAILSFFNPFSSAKVLVAKWASSGRTEKGIEYSVADITSADSEESGITKVEVSIDENYCANGCSVAIVIATPGVMENDIEGDSDRRRTTGSQGRVRRLAEGVVVSPLLDMTLPRTFSDTKEIRIQPDESSRLSVDISLSKTIASPRDTVDVTVKLSDTSGLAVTGDVMVVMVDKAMLDLSPVNLNTTETSLYRLLHPTFHTSSVFQTTSDYLSSALGYQRAKDILLRRFKRDPYLHQSWPILASDYSGRDLAMDDMAYFDQHYTSLSYNDKISFAMGSGDLMMMEDDGIESNIMAVKAPMAGIAEGAAEGVATMASFKEEDVQTGVHGETGGSVGGSNIALPRSQFEMVPLWVGSARVTSNGTFNTSVDLPDNVGTYTIFAYAIGGVAANGKSPDMSGVNLSGLTVRKPVATLQEKMPRVVRAGDVFKGGVIVTATDVDFRGKLDVTIEVQNEDQMSSPVILCGSDGIATEEPLGATLVLDVEYSAPVVGDFQLCADGVGNVSFLITLKDGSDVLDQLAINATVSGVMPTVTLGTSTGVDSDIASPYPEGIVLPAAVPNSGHLSISVGVGRLPAVLAMTTRLMESTTTPDNRSVLDPLASAPSLVSVPGALQAVSIAYEALPKEDIELVSQVAITAVNRLKAYTTSAAGLSYTPVTTWQPHRANVWLNAFALYALKDMDDNTIDLTTMWKNAMVKQIKADLDEALSMPDGEYTDWTSLTWAYAALNPDYDFERPQISFESLETKIQDESLGIQALFALICQRGKDRQKCNVETVTSIKQSLLNNMRVQGRTAYISYEGSAMSALQTTALALSLFSTRDEGQGFVANIDKLANFVSQLGNVESGVGASDSQMLLCVMALADYDRVTDSASPDLEVSIVQGDEDIFKESFGPNNDKRGAVIMHEYTYGGKPAIDPLDIYVDGRGEVQVVTLMQFTPLKVNKSPIIRGLSAEKVIQRTSNSTNSPTGPALTADDVINVGEIVQITIQIVSPDDVTNVNVVDESAGGLEAVTVTSLNPPIQPHNRSYRRRNFEQVFSSSGFAPSSTSSMKSWYWQWNPFEYSAIDRYGVKFYASRLRAGTYTLSYTALCVTKGAFSFPPTHVYSEPQPEIMGLSAGGWLVTSVDMKSINPDRAVSASTNQPLVRVRTSAETTFSTGRFTQQTSVRTTQAVNYVTSVTQTSDSKASVISLVVLLIMLPTVVFALALVVCVGVTKSIYQKLENSENGEEEYELEASDDHEQITPQTE